MIFDPHRGCHAQRLVNPTEVVAPEVQSQSSPQILPLLGEGVRQTREPANPHTHREILPLNMGCANPTRVGIAEN